MADDAKKDFEDAMERFEGEIYKMDLELTHYKGNVCDRTVARINALAVSAAEAFGTYGGELEAGAGTARANKALDEAVIEREGFSGVPYEELPWYVTEMLYGDAERDFAEEKASAEEDLFETAWKADSVLTDEAKAVLGGRYAKYAAERAGKESEEYCRKKVAEHDDAAVRLSWKDLRCPESAEEKHPDGKDEPGG